MIWGYLTAAILAVIFLAATIPGYQLDLVWPAWLTTVLATFCSGYVLGIGIRVTKAYFF